MKVEQTAQQLDPLGVYSTWLIAPAMAGIAVVYTVASTLNHLDQIAYPGLAVAGVLLAVAASVILVWKALPRRSPFRRTSLLLVLVPALAGGVCFTLAMWDRNKLIQDDWAQVVAALLIVAMAQLRTPRELGIAALLSAAILGVGAAAQSSFLAIPVNPLIYAVVAATPPALIGLGAAAYSRSMLRATARWRRHARAGMAEREVQVRESVARSVQQTSVTRLNQAAVPLFERVLLNGWISDSDVDAATAIARDLRGQAIEALQASWLDDVVERARSIRDVPLELIGERPVIDAVSFDQRAVLTAAILELFHAADCSIQRMTLSARVIERTTATSSSAWLSNPTSSSAWLSNPTSSAWLSNPTSLSEPTLSEPTLSEPPLSEPTLSEPTSSEPTLSKPTSGSGAVASRPAIARLKVVAVFERGGARAARARLMPYFTVLRVIADTARLVVTRDQIELGFSYDMD